MRRGWILVLAISIGFNIGLLVVQLSGSKGLGRTQGPLRFPPARGEMDGGRPARGEIDGRRPGIAGPPGRDVNEMVDKHLARMSDQLGLNERQRATIETSLREYLPLILQHQRQAEEARRALAEYYSAPGMDAGQFRTLIADINLAQAKIDSLVGEAMLGEASMLTPEQRESYFKEMPWGRQGRPESRPR